MIDGPKTALGIDYGTKRIGYAVSDGLGWSARPLEVYARKDLEQDLAYLAALVESQEIVRIVIGIPYRLNGDAGPEAVRAQGFVDSVRLALPGIEVSTIDEALTTFEANRLMDEHGVKNREKKKKLRDAYAAAVLLQEDLDLRASARKQLEFDGRDSEQF